MAALWSGGRVCGLALKLTDTFIHKQRSTKMKKIKLDGRKHMDFPIIMRDGVLGFAVKDRKIFIKTMKKDGGKKEAVLETAGSNQAAMKRMVKLFGKTKRIKVKGENK
jgi:hypothetical protein